MGVKHLNSYFVSHCSTVSIETIDFESCRGKIVVVDTSIYLYKFLEKSSNRNNKTSFMEQLYHFLSMFLRYKICAVFIFDGKSPPEKYNLLQNRYTEKKNAESKYDEIQNHLLTLDKNSGEYMDACRELMNLQKKIVRLRREHILQAKELMTAFGFAYYDAPGESDQLCAHFVKSGVAWACLSDDMDMFLLDCPRVLRSMSLMQHTWTLYHTAGILKDLDISLRDLTEIVVLCGSDYNRMTMTNQQINIPSIKNMFSIYYHEYKKCKKENDDDQINDKQCNHSFYEWYKTYKTETSDMSTEKMSHLCSLFNIDNYVNILQPYCDSFCKEEKNQIKMDNLKKIMENHGFIFLGRK